LWRPDDSSGQPDVATLLVIEGTDHKSVSNKAEFWDAITKE